MLLTRLIKLLWHKEVPLKVLIFAWRLFRDQLPTKNNLIRRNIINLDSSSCVGRCGSLETVNHLFLRCSTFGAVWYHIYSWLGWHTTIPYEAVNHFIQFNYGGGVSKLRQSILHLIWFATVWEIWKERNNRIFNAKECSIAVLVDKIKLLSYRWLMAKTDCPFNYHSWWLRPLTLLGMF